MRTKLRLDLNEVEKQINEMEKTVRKDKSEENIKALEKLKDYEKKLKAEYEKMTGISVDQATSLKESRIGIFSEKESSASKFFGLLTGFALFNAFYNLALHGIFGFTPNDLLEWYSGSGESYPNFLTIAASIRYDTSQYFVTAPLIIAVLFSLITTFTSKKGSNGWKMLNTLALAGFVGFFFYLTILPGSDESTVTRFEKNYFYFAMVLMVLGFLSLMSLLDRASKLSKFCLFLSGILIIVASVQMLYIFVTAGNVLEELLLDWPWIMLVLMVSSLFYALASFFR